MLTDIEIAANNKMKNISEIAHKLEVKPNELELYGNYKAKLSDSLFDRVKKNKDGKLILVTAINPTPAGEGKTTVSIGLADALTKLSKKAVLALREPSMGPVFGLKGGATGGGYAQVVPMEDINLHFTGDIHAVTAANNLLCAMIDNHIHQGNSLQIDQRKVLIERCVDINDRQLRSVVSGLGSAINGIPREDKFIISVASEVMAILCLSQDISELKERLGNILVAYSYKNEAIYCKDLKANGAMAVILKDALKPNLVQTLEKTPAIIHGGPFANIAHGCNSVKATKLALKLADYCVTEAGFGSDLGAEKFFDIKCRKAKLTPNVVVLVATARALKYNGGVEKPKLNEENLEALRKGIVNLEAHIENLKKFNLPLLVCINKFSSDTAAELEFIKQFCADKSVDCVVSEAFEMGSDGALNLAEKVSKLCENDNENFSPIYSLELSLEEKIEKVCKEIYGANAVEYSSKAKKALDKIKLLGRENLPICIAKTQYSLSDNAKLLGRPCGFTATVSDMKLSNGAEFVVVYMGSIVAMPGLPKVPAAENIDIDENLCIKGLF